MVSVEKRAAERRITAAARAHSKELELSGFGLKAVPESVGNLTALTHLDLSNNQLTAIPESVGNLTALTRLDLHFNQLRVVPEWIGNLTALTRLDLSGNQLRVVPESVGNLTALTDLYLNDNNQLTAVPESVGNLTALVRLDLSGNEGLSSPPPEVAAQGTEAVLGFLRGLRESSVKRWQSKVLIVGEATVGKTSLARKLFGEPFNPEEKQTHGVRVRSLHVRHPGREEATMSLDVWDFGGQLEYRATQRFYLTDRSLFLLVWNSRARAADGKILAWLEAIRARAPGSPVLIVATHGAEGPASLPGNLRGLYPQIAGDLTIDSRTGLGIEGLRSAVARHAADLPLMGAPWPVSWDAAARALAGDPRRTIAASRAFRLMEEAGVRDPDTRGQLARILHDLGQIAYFADFRDLRGKIILKPQWLDERITQVLDSLQVHAAGGVLSRAERDRLWKDLADGEDDPDLPASLTLMMETFDLAYRTGDADDSKDVAIVVDCLPEAPPPDIGDRWNEARRAGGQEIGIIFKLSSRQAGIPTWFIAREHRYTTGCHWRHGALLANRDPGNPAWALIEDDGREQPTITLRATGAYPGAFLSVLTEAFTSIIDEHYPGLTRDRLVPCPCQDGSGRCGHAFLLDELIAEIADPDSRTGGAVRCPKSRDWVDAAPMLDGLPRTGISRELDGLRDTITAMNGTLSDLGQRQQASLDGIRALAETRANAGKHCPSLLTIREGKGTGLLRRARITVTLWCESPAGPHPLEGDDGNYTVTRVPDALIRYLPYLGYLITALGLAQPALASAGVKLSDQASAQVKAAASTLKFIEKHAGTARKVAEHGFPGPGRRTVVQAETGADFRALYNMLRELDKDDKWGGLDPRALPESSRIVYLCEHHAREFDYPYQAGPSRR